MVSVYVCLQLRSLPGDNCRGPFIIVAPLSLINQWNNEAKAWVPDLNIIVYHGNRYAFHNLTCSGGTWRGSVILFLPAARTSQLLCLH